MQATIIPIIIKVITRDTLCTTTYPNKFIFVLSLRIMKKYLMALYDTVIKNTHIIIVIIFISILISLFIANQLKNRIIGNPKNTIIKKTL